MQKNRKISNFILLLSILYLLASCRSAERIAVCSLVDSMEIEPIEVCEVSVTLNACFCTPNYDFNTMEAVEPFIAFPLIKCEGIMGPVNTTILSEIQPNFKALQRLKEKHCQ